MNAFKSILPKIVFLTGVIFALISMWNMMGWTYAMFFGGAILMIVALYLYDVMMGVEVADE